MITRAWWTARSPKHGCRRRPSPPFRTASRSLRAGLMEPPFFRLEISILPVWLEEFIGAKRMNTAQLTAAFIILALSISEKKTNRTGKQGQCLGSDPAGGLSKSEDFAKLCPPSQRRTPEQAGISVFAFRQPDVFAGAALRDVQLGSLPPLCGWPQRRCLRLPGLHGCLDQTMESRSVPTIL